MVVSVVPVSPVPVGSVLYDSVVLLSVVPAAVVGAVTIYKNKKSNGTVGHLWDWLRLILISYKIGGINMSKASRQAVLF